MLRRLVQRIGALSVAAVLALALAACGGEAPSTDSSTSPATTTEDAASTDVHYKCTKEGCEKTKTVAKGVAAPS